MKRKPLEQLFSGRARKYLRSLSLQDQAIVEVHIDALAENDLGSLKVKSLRGPIRELIVGPHRIVYFTIGHVIYFPDAFRKRGRKTPRRAINYALATYKECVQFLERGKRRL